MTIKAAFSTQLYTYHLGAPCNHPLHLREARWGGNFPLRQKWWKSHSPVFLGPSSTFKHQQKNTNHNGKTAKKLQVQDFSLTFSSQKMDCWVGKNVGNLWCVDAKVRPWWPVHDLLPYALPEEDWEQGKGWKCMETEGNLQITTGAKGF